MSPLTCLWLSVYLHVTSCRSSRETAMTYESFLFQPCSYISGVFNFASQGSTCNQVLESLSKTCKKSVRKISLQSIRVTHSTTHLVPNQAELVLYTIFHVYVFNIKAANRLLFSITIFLCRMLFLGSSQCHQAPLLFLP